MKIRNNLFYSLPLILMATGSQLASAADLEPFAGIDLGTYKTKVKTKKPSTSDDIESRVVAGIHGGYIVNQNHRMTLGLDRKAYKAKDSHDSDDTDVWTGYMQYDYLVPVTQNITWNIGPRLGYEKFDSKSKDFNGLVYGAQTGLEYKTGNWGFGGEVIYLAHDKEVKAKGTSTKVKLDNETQLKLNVNYYF
ncbi:outer membrane beta-barrel protein [Endozoicomonas arenosclerae]|uniref:outer membrane beta-barrel protein n=1 Tax=Endozoicomonas arenosclerae TaxID=1633495 RepID=UPI0007850109|nr:outer membrane beta-barrel protein [Endozoicomonas arenosclerae]